MRQLIQVLFSLVYRAEAVTVTEFQVLTLKIETEGRTRKSPKSSLAAGRREKRSRINTFRGVSPEAKEVS